MRKTFTDLIDGVANPGGEAVQTPVGNNDWYMFTGIFLTYKIFNVINECPAYEEKSHRIKSNSRVNKSGRWFFRPRETRESILEKIEDVK